MSISVSPLITHEGTWTFYSKLYFKRMPWHENLAMKEVSYSPNKSLIVAILQKDKWLVFLLGSNEASSLIPLYISYLYGYAHGLLLRKQIQNLAWQPLWVLYCKYSFHDNRSILKPLLWSSFRLSLRSFLKINLPPGFSVDRFMLAINWMLLNAATDPEIYIHHRGHHWPNWIWSAPARIMHLPWGNSGHSIHEGWRMARI